MSGWLIANIVIDTVAILIATIGSNIRSNNNKEAIKLIHKKVDGTLNNVVETDKEFMNMQDFVERTAEYELTFKWRLRSKISGETFEIPETVWEKHEGIVDCINVKKMNEFIKEIERRK